MEDTFIGVKKGRKDAMQSGIEMMLKSMGIQTDVINQLLEPERIKLLLTKIETMCNSVEETKAAVLRIETKLGTLPESLAMKLLADGQTQAFQDAVEYVRGYNGDNCNGSSDNGNDANNRADQFTIYTGR